MRPFAALRHRAHIYAHLSLLALSLPSASWAAPIELQRIYSGPTVHVLAPASAGWCQQEVTLYIFGPTQEDFITKDRLMFGYQAEIASAVRRECPQMETAVVYALAGTLNALRPMPGGYFGKLDDHPKVMLDYKYFSKSQGETAGVALPTYALRDSDKGRVASAEKAIQADNLARQRGELAAPSKEQMQSYITSVFAKMADTESYAGDEVIKKVGHTVLARYTNTVENLDCAKSGSKFICAMSIRSSTGPSVFLEEQTSQTLHPVSDVCLWRARELFCDESEKLVARTIADRQRATVTARRNAASDGRVSAGNRNDDAGIPKVDPVKQLQDNFEFFDSLKKIR